MPVAARVASLLMAVSITVVGCRRAPEEVPSAEQAAEPPAQTQPQLPAQTPPGQGAPSPVEQAVPPVVETPEPNASAAAPPPDEGSPVAALTDGTGRSAAGPQQEQAPQPGQPDCAEAGAAKQPAAERFKKDVACHIHSRNTGHLYDGAPPPVLRSVVVLSVRIDAKGKPVRIAVVRSNGIRELERRAIQSVRSAAPLPLPGALAQRQGSAEITETWLFRDDGRFRVRTLAAVQAQSGL